MPANTPIWKGYPEGALAETAASGELRLGERITYTTQHAGRYADALAYALAHDSILAAERTAHGGGSPGVQSETVGGVDAGLASGELYTAGQIARALGVTKRAVLDWNRRRGAQPSGKKLVRGQRADAWAFCALPVEIQARLERCALEQNFRTSGALLASFGTRGAPAPAAAAAAVRGKGELFVDLVSSFADHIKDRKALSREDREWAWKEICLEYQALIATGAGPERGAVKKALVDVLLRELPALTRAGARNPLAALRRDFERKWTAFQKSGVEALRDGRRARSGNYREILCLDCWKKFLALDGAKGGNESGAWRKLNESGELCELCRDKHCFDPRQDKSYVPHSIRKAATPLVNAALPWVKSDSAGRMAGPYTPGDWSDTQPGDYFVGDDVTWNHEVYDLDERGRPRIFRPECLYYADQRTGYPLGFLLIDGHYNGRHIRRLMLNVCCGTSPEDRGVGMPHVGWKHENGIWRAQAVRDTSREGWIGFRETQQGFKANGCPLFKFRFTKPRNPRGKTVEGEFRILQETMRVLPGFVGFNERRDRSDNSKDLKRRVLAGKEHPGNYYYSFEEWGKRISKVFEEFANTIQNGARNDGKSPRENWIEGLKRKPLRALPTDMFWLMSTYKQLKTVTPRGIVLEFGKHQKWTFADEKLSRFIGQQVWVLYHIDRPGLVTIRDYKETEHFTMEGIRCLANTAGASVSEAERKIAAFNRVSKVIAGTIKHELISTITRDGDFTQAERDFGREVIADKAQCLDTARRATDARTARQREGERLMREARMEAGQETQSERLAL